jgi:hypothetical protein
MHQQVRLLIGSSLSFILLWGLSLPLLCRWGVSFGDVPLSIAGKGTKGEREEIILKAIWASKPWPMDRGVLCHFQWMAQNTEIHIFVSIILVGKIHIFLGFSTCMLRSHFLHKTAEHLQVNCSTWTTNNMAIILMSEKLSHILDHTSVDSAVKTLLRFTPNSPFN